MILANNEIILNEWDYAISNTFKRNTKHNLTVTNKRIVSSVANRKGVFRREVAIDTVHNVTLRHEKPSKLGPVLRILLSLLLIAGSIFSMYEFNWIYELPSVIMVCLFSVGLFFSGALQLNQGYFYIELTTNQIGENAVMSVGYEKLTRRISTKKLRIAVDNKSARDIIERIGALIFQHR